MSIEFSPLEIFKEVRHWFKERTYRQEYLAKICDVLLGEDWAPNDNKYLLDMKQAYVPLKLTRDGSESESIETIFLREQKIVIQGGPGSGKSTLVRYIMLKMAGLNLEHKSRKMPTSQMPILFPVKIDLIKCNDSSTLEDLFAKSIRNLGLDIWKTLSKGGILCIFDGLDEVASLPQREMILGKIAEISKEFNLPKKPNYFLITTRSVGYSHKILAGANFSLYTIQALSYQQQQEMIQKYYQYWANKSIALPAGFSSLETLAKHLLEQMDKNASFERLRSNPLLLSQIILTQYMGKKIPSVKRELYENCILQLVQRHAGSGDKAIDVLSKETSDRLIFLGGIAFLLHQIKDPGAITLKQAVAILRDIKQSLQDLTISDEQVPDVLNTAVENWGVLTKSKNPLMQDVYKFANLSFEEYLIANFIHKHPWQKKYWKFITEKQFLSTNWGWWEEIILLYAGMQEQMELPANRVIDIVLNSKGLENIWVKAGYCMLNSPHPSRVHQREKIIDTLKQQVHELHTLDAQAALEVLIQVEPDGIKHVLSSILNKDDVFFSEKKYFIDLIAKVSEPVSRQILRDAIICILQRRSKHLDVDILDDTDYIELAEVLGKLGDIRLGQMCMVHSDDKRIPSFQIAQYPVTNIEFQVYVNETRAVLPLHWKGEFPAHLANHPVTNVSYDDAVAYCKWLSDKQHRKYRLPTENEWVLMAYEGKRANGNNFPWKSNELQANLLNYRARYDKSTKTTPVGLYCNGRTPALEIFDVLGNVWEWTDTKKGEKHIVKGIGWDATDAGQGINAAELVKPNEKRDNLGFRILLEI